MSVIHDALRRHSDSSPSCSARGFFQEGTPTEQFVYVEIDPRFKGAVESADSLELKRLDTCQPQLLLKKITTGSIGQAWDPSSQTERGESHLTVTKILLGQYKESVGSLLLVASDARGK